MLSDPVDSNDKFVFYSLKKSNFDWKSYDDLKKLKIGAAIGYTYPEEFLAYTKEHGINLMLVAKDMGYDSNPMIGFDSEKVAEIINLPEDHVISMFLVIGKQIKPAMPRGGQLSLDEVIFKDKF